MIPFKDINGCRLTNCYGIKNDRYTSGKHDGVDLVSDGDKTVLAITSGKVIRSGWNDSWGNYIVIEMQDKRAVVYAHLSSRAVMIEEYVTAGHKLGIMGNTGHSTGAHLHIELQRQYYKAGRVDDICALMGIKNVVGKVELVEVEGVDDMRKAQQWELDLIKKVCEQKGMDAKLWQGKAMDQVAVADLFMILAKM